MQIVAVLRISEMVMTAEDHYIEAGSVEFDREAGRRTKHLKTQEAYLHNVGSLRQHCTRGTEEETKSQIQKHAKSNGEYGKGVSDRVRICRHWRTITAKAEQLLARARGKLRRRQRHTRQVGVYT